MSNCYRSDFMEDWKWNFEEAHFWENWASSYHSTIISCHRELNRKKQFVRFYQMTSSRPGKFDSKGFCQVIIFMDLLSSVQLWSGSMKCLRYAIFIELILYSKLPKNTFIHTLQLQRFSIKIVFNGDFRKLFSSRILSENFQITYTQCPLVNTIGVYP